MSSLTRLQAFAAVAIAAAWFTPSARAGCLDIRTAPIAGLHVSAPRVRTVAFSDEGNDRAPIVGLWKIQFILPGAGPMGEDVVIDDGYATWHSDGTELMNSSRAPMTGQVVAASSEGRRSAARQKEYREKNTRRRYPVPGRHRRWSSQDTKGSGASPPVTESERVRRSSPW